MGRVHPSPAQSPPSAGSLSSGLLLAALALGFADVVIDGGAHGHVGVVPPHGIALVRRTGGACPPVRPKITRWLTLNHGTSLRTLPNTWYLERGQPLHIGVGINFGPAVEMAAWL
jgi:hypothetical protein